jgi:hypothetical protein
MTDSADGFVDGALVNGDDFVGLQALVHRYTAAVIERNGVAWGATWAQDAIWELGPDRHVEGRDAIVALWRGAMTRFHAVVQVVHSGELHYAGSPDHVTGRWYINEWYRRSDGQSGTLLAHYDDAYVRSADGWLFTRRKLVSYYNGAPDLSGDFTNHRDALEGRGLAPDV